MLWQPPIEAKKLVTVTYLDLLALATHLGYVCVSFISHMAQQSARLQAS